jgi:hypothetical protein
MAIPVSGDATPLPKSSNRLCSQLIALPRRSITARVLVLPP